MDTCLATNAMDGLGIGSIYALNASLLFKWIWQFRCSPNDLWVKVIKEIHEIDGGIGRGRLVKSSQSPWNAIVRSVHHLQSKGIHLLSACYRSVGDGNNIRFWDETLCGDRPLKEWFHREVTKRWCRDDQFTALLDVIRDVILSNSKDG
ncbi:hypothetical protein Tco_0934156 [Tanacetum coccineum]